MNTLEQAIKNCHDSRELKRLLAVKLAEKGLKYQEIAENEKSLNPELSKWVATYEKREAKDYV